MTTPTKPRGRPRGYKTKSGEVVPSVTQINSIIGDKGKTDGLCYWVQRLTQEGKDWSQERSRAGRVGECTHALVTDWLEGVETDLEEYSPREVKHSVQVFEAFKDWAQQGKIETLATERPIVSEMHKFGGTSDIVCRVFGKLTVIDLKTSKKVDINHLRQLAAYAHLWFEQEKEEPVQGIIWLSQPDTGGYNTCVRWMSVLNETCWPVFQDALRLLEQVKKERGLT